MPSWLSSLLTLPISGGMLGLFYLLLPVPRWTRTMKSYLATHRDLPEGPQRDWFGAEATKLAQRIIEYKRDFPWSYKAVGWVAVGAMTGFFVSFLLDGPAVSIKGFEYQFGPLWWWPVGLAVICGMVATVSTLLGRNVMARTPSQQMAAEDAEIRAVHRATFRATVRRRARRVKKLSIEAVKNKN